MVKQLILEKINIENQDISYHVFGNGEIEIVIEMGLGAVVGEWWHIAESLSSKYTVLLYERGRNISISRYPMNIAKELFLLLEALQRKDKIIILSHSQGGLYAQQFARMYRDMVRGIVFMDPLSANDNKYKEAFTSIEEQKKSGFDKSKNFVIMKKMASMHLGFLIKILMKKAPPFYYYNGFSKEAKKYILSELTKVSLHDASLEEYRLAHDENEINNLKNKWDFPEIPIVLITHGQEFEIMEIMDFGQTTYEFAKRVEDLWQELMKDYLSFSTQSYLLVSNNSGHYIHLSDFELVKKAIEMIVNRND